MAEDTLFETGVPYPRPVERKLGSREFMESIRSHPTAGAAAWFLGQNGFVLKAANGAVIAVDPYLSDYCASREDGAPRNSRSRMLPVFIEPEDFSVDAVFLTHSHCDHADPATLRRLAGKDRCKFFAPYQTLPILREAGIKDEAIVPMHPRQEETFREIKITGTFAEPTDSGDLNHMGYLFAFPGGFVFYDSGDTARSELLSYVKEYRPTVAAVCINGGYHNLSHWEAAKIVAAISPSIAVPCHYDMFPHNFQPPAMFRKSLSTLAPQVRYLEMEYYTPYDF